MRAGEQEDGGTEREAGRATMRARARPSRHRRPNVSTKNATKTAGTKKTTTTKRPGGRRADRAERRALWWADAADAAAAVLAAVLADDDSSGGARRAARTKAARSRKAADVARAAVTAGATTAHLRVWRARTPLTDDQRAAKRTKDAARRAKAKAAA
jgi:hypothetical protein